MLEAVRDSQGSSEGASIVDTDVAEPEFETVAPIQIEEPKVEVVEDANQVEIQSETVVEESSQAASDTLAQTPAQVEVQEPVVEPHRPMYREQTLFDL